MMNERDTLRVNGEGHLEIGGCDAVELAKKYGTPLYVMDETHIRKMARIYADTLQAEYGFGTVLYASKAFSCKDIYRIVNSEGLGIDVVSGGELYTALSVGFPADKIYFHGNNKSSQEIELGLNSGVNHFVADSLDELSQLEKISAAHGKMLNVLLRVNPGVEAHTHHYIQTAKQDSKFGLSLEKGFALEAVLAMQKCPHLHFSGLHCHIGSQIFEYKAFEVAAERMTAFMSELKNAHGIVTEELNMGGGFGVWYAEGDAKFSAEQYADYLKIMIRAVKAAVEKNGLQKPKLLIEPGRSMVAEAGVTLYSAGNTKDITGLRKYLSVDGGMFENPRYALYQAVYTSVCASRMNAPHDEKWTLAGKCCESGDMLIDTAYLPKDVRRGEIIAVFTTGAYHYSMASNYNRNAVPPVVKVKNGESEYMVKPQTYEDLVRNDI